MIPLLGSLLALLLLLGLPQLASAVTLQVTEGRIDSVPEETDNCGGFDGTFRGERFGVGGCTTGTRTVDYDELAPPGDRPLVTTWGYDLSGADSQAQVGALECHATRDPEGVETCGFLTFTHAAPVVLPADWDFAIPFTATVPFTLTGFLTFPTGERFDLIGHGLFTWEDQRRFWPPTVGRYAFLPPTTVPEPATGVLLAFGLVGLAGWRRLRAR